MTEVKLIKHWRAKAEGREADKLIMLRPIRRPKIKDCVVVTLLLTKKLQKIHIGTIDILRYISAIRSGVISCRSESSNVSLVVLELAITLKPPSQYYLNSIKVYSA